MTISFKRAILGAILVCSFAIHAAHNAYDGSYGVRFHAPVVPPPTYAGDPDLPTYDQALAQGLSAGTYSVAQDTSSGESSMLSNFRDRLENCSKLTVAAGTLATVAAAYALYKTGAAAAVAQASGLIFTHIFGAGYHIAALTGTAVEGCCRGLGVVMGACRPLTGLIVLVLGGQVGWRGWKGLDSANNA